MNYATLLTTVASRLNRDDLTALIPDFVARAEEEINARLATTPIRPMGAISTSAIATASGGLPADFVDVIDLSAADATESWQLVRLDAASPSGYYATRSLPYSVDYDSTRPRHYSIVGSTLVLSAAPASVLTLTMRYWQRLPVLATALNNWLSDRHSDVYELGALAHAYRHLRDDAARDAHKAMFGEALELAMASYPEMAQPGELRSDLPITTHWSILNG